MRTQGSKRFVLPVCGILVLLVVGLARTIRREMRRQERNQALIAAVKAAQAQTVQELLHQGADPDAIEIPPQKVSLWNFLRERIRGLKGEHTGMPALALAVSGVRSPYEDKAGYARGVAIVKALLDHRARVDVKDTQGVDIINLAIESDYDEQILRLLIQHLGHVSHRPGNDQPSLLDLKNPLNGRTPLRSAAAWGSPEAIDLLLRAGAKVDLPDDQGQTALMYAVEKGRPENIACLLTYHANVLLKDRSGNTALSIARTNEAGNVITSFHHEREEDFWPNIVQMLEKALNLAPNGLNSSMHAVAAATPERDAQNLLAKARKLTRTKNWWLSTSCMNPQNYMTYFWISADRLLYFSDAEQEAPLLCEENMRTGKKTAFHTISKMWSEDGTYKKQIEISPDGQWILWSGDYRDGAFHGYYGAKRDGSSKFYVAGGSHWEIGFDWMPDSRHFCEETGRYDEHGEFKRLTMVMRSVDAPQVAHTLTSRPSLLHRWTVSIPSTEERREMQISPDGRRIAWIVITPTDSQKSQRVAVNISSLDGGAMQEVGHLLSPATEEAEPPFERYPNEMKWLPDGRHVSFIYHDILYVLPAP